MSTKILEPSIKMTEAMNEERAKCKELVDREPESVELRRMAIRSLFSIIEGLCSRMKNIAFFIGRLREMVFKKGEIAMINEETYYLDEKGEVRIREYFPSMKSNVRFAFKIFARAYESDFELDVGSSGFEEFQEAVKIRNRVTHPEGIKDLDVSQDDFDKVIRAYDWFVSNQQKLYEEIEREPKTRS